MARYHLMLCEKDDQTAFEEKGSGTLALREGDRIEYPEAAKWYAVINVAWTVEKIETGDLTLVQQIHAVEAAHPGH